MVTRTVWASAIGLAMVGLSGCDILDALLAALEDDPVDRQDTCEERWEDCILDNQDPAFCDADLDDCLDPGDPNEPPVGDCDQLFADCLQTTNDPVLCEQDLPPECFDPGQPPENDCDEQLADCLQTTNDPVLCAQEFDACMVDC